MNPSDPLILSPGEVADTRDDPEPEWIIDPELSSPDFDYSAGDPADI